MLKNNTSGKSYLILALMCLLGLASCKSYKNIAYFTDLDDSAKIVTIAPAVYSQPVIKVDDILSITIQTMDPASSSVINQTMSMPAVGASSGASIGNQQISGFLVDKNGEVQLTMVGKVKLEGLSTDQARELIKERVSQYYKEPSVQVRFANFKVTVIGEVAKPAVYTIPNEKVSVLDALGLAGDLTIYGRRENVLLVREDNGKKDFVRFNLNSADIFRSPYFYLRQNDVIYVEPNTGKAASTDAARTRTLTIIASVISLAIVAISRLL